MIFTERDEDLKRRWFQEKLFKMCPFNEKLCIHPDWADCQFECAIGDDKYIELYERGAEDTMGKNCCFLPEGISRLGMMDALGCSGEEARRRVLERIKSGEYAKRGEMYEWRSKGR